MMKVNLVLLLTALEPVWSRVAPPTCSTHPNQLIPDPGGDCTVFYQCLTTTSEDKHKFVCPAGLVFNPEKSLCDWPPAGADTTSCSFPTPLQPTNSEVPPTSAATTTITTSSPSPSTLTSSSTTTTESDPKTTPTSSQITSTSSSCSSESSEPISPELKNLRKSTCMLSNKEVDKILPNRPDNPQNVKTVESILSHEKFQEIFPKANPSYTYTNFLKAVGKFPSVCKSVKLCKKTLATIFAHFEQETAGLFYLEEIAKSNYCATWSRWVKEAYPCSPGKQYFGRGSKQLSWNYNYGAFSVAMYGNTSVLLEHPELVAETWLNFASAFWFFVTPQPPKPSMQHVVEGTWTPNDVDLSAGRVSGFGATILIINGAYECGSADNAQSLNRQRHYRRYCEMFGITIAPEERVDCAGMGKFSAAGSANPAIYWAPEQNCKLVSWQTAFSALIEGQLEQCKQASRARSQTYWIPSFYLWPNYIFY